MAATFDLLSPFKYFNIAPVTDWERFINPQFNISFNRFDAETENRVLARAGSYGKQIGRMQEVLDILIARLPSDELSPAETRSIEKYCETRNEVLVAVAEAKPGGVTSGDVDALLDRLATLRGDDPEQFERLSARIEQFLATGATPKATPTPRKRGRS